MRRFLVLITAAVVALAIPAPAHASVNAGSAASAGHGWVPAPQETFDRAAGVLCDFAIHSQPVVDEVMKLTLSTYPDGSPEAELFKGALILEVTNTETGAATGVDASGTALVRYGTDGSMTWYVEGPVMAGFREGGGNLPRGLWVIDGVYVIDFTPTFVKTVTLIHGTTHNVCTDID